MIDVCNEHLMHFNKVKKQSIYGIQRSVASSVVWLDQAIQGLTLSFDVPPDRLKQNKENKTRAVPPLYIAKLWNWVRRPGGCGGYGTSPKIEVGPGSLPREFLEF